MGESKVKKGFYVKVGAVIAISLFLVVAGLLLLQNWESGFGTFSEHEFGNSEIKYNGQEYLLNENIETFLVIGLDKFDGEGVSDSYNNNKQADFLMLFIFDNEAKTCTALHINRDTMAEVNVLGVAGNTVSTLTKQIALAHTYGNGKDVSCRNTMDSVSALLKGMKINHYASVTLDAVSELNDLVGGVEVEILDDFSGVDDSLVKGETVKLTGEQALHYVRSRQGLDDSTNGTRMQRQRQYINALHKSLQACIAADQEFIVNVSLEMSDHLVSDRSVTQLQTLAEKFNQYEFLGIRDIAGTTAMGEEYVEFYPNEELLQELVIDLFYREKE